MMKDILKVHRPYECKYLYHYCSVEIYSRIEAILKDSKIYFQSPNSFNDPFDCRPNISLPNPLSKALYLKEMVHQKFPNADSKQSRKRLKQAKQRFTKSNLKQLTDDFIADNGVFCLSETKGQLLLWAHYAKSHSGICFMFRSDQENTIFWEALKIKYQEHPPKIDPTKVELGDEGGIFKSLLIKSEHWNYEQEWRLIRPKIEGGPGYYSYNPDLLCGIVLGTKMSDEKKSRIIRDSRAHKTKIRIYNAQLNESEYKLDFIEI